MESFLATDFLKLHNFLAFAAILFGVIFLRYLLFVLIFHFPVRRLYEKKSLHNGKFQPNQLAKEIGWSAITSLIFSIVGVFFVILWQKGSTGIYLDFDRWPLWYLPISLIIFLLLHETYYYWLHRWMHRPGIYQWMHKTHHDSLHTTAMTSFSFHPLEAVLQAIILPILALFIPIHLYLLFFLLLLMTVSGTINHVGYEMFPTWWNTNPISKWIIGASHHHLHHRYFNSNYGLYFSFWDRWMKTNRQ